VCGTHLGGLCDSKLAFSLSSLISTAKSLFIQAKSNVLTSFTRTTSNFFFLQKAFNMSFVGEHFAVGETASLAEQASMAKRVCAAHTRAIRAGAGCGSEIEWNWLERQV
jgi:hypothetical protein